MTTLSDYAPSLLAWLLETSWQVAVLIGLILLVRGFLGTWISPAWRYGLWCLVLIRLLLPVLPGSPFSVFNLLVTEQTSIEALTFQWAPVPVTLSTLPPSQAAQSMIVEGTEIQNSLFLVVWIWLLGVSVCLLRVIRCYGRLRRLLARLPKIQDRDLLILLTGCARQLGLRRSPRILAAPFLNSPAVTGLRQPVLLWPPQLAQELNPDQQRLVLLHELAHIKHQDLLIQGLSGLLQALYWFHPLVWLAFRQLRIDQELACDAEVMALSGAAQHREYGHAILKLVRQPDALTEVVLGFNGRYRALEQRIRLISRASRSVGPLPGAVLMAFIAAIGLTGASNSLLPQAESVRFANAIPPSSFAKRLAATRGLNLEPKLGIRLSGLLQRPEGQGLFPALVLLPGCQGRQPYQDDWAQRLALWGYVVLQVDSLGSRGVKDYCTRLYSASYPHSGHFIADAYDALAFLSQQPFVDTDRIAVMGWAQIATLAAISVDGLQQVHPYKFRAAVALYPNCSLGSKGEFYAPSLVLIGAQDDWTPAQACQVLAQKQIGVDHPMTLKVYPQARHGFDDPIPGGERYEEQVQNLTKFPAQGATLGYDPNAHSDAIRTVKDFLARHL